MNNLERLVRELTTEINGQYPRPWMTNMRDPWSARVFVVGYNPAKAYSVENLDHERHIDALFNRNSESCRGLYSEVTRASPTRGNIEMLTAKLAAVGITSILETNVVCYATRKKKDLGRPEHIGGKSRGVEIFRTIVREICPRSMIIHGVGVREEFNRSFAEESNLLLPPPPNRLGVFPQIDLPTGTRVFVIPSLALPGYRNWPPQNSFCNWADEYLDELALQIARVCVG